MPAADVVAEFGRNLFYAAKFLSALQFNTKLDDECDSILVFHLCGLFTLSAWCI